MSHNITPTYTVQAGDTLKDIARQMPLKEFSLTASTDALKTVFGKPKAGETIDFRPAVALLKKEQKPEATKVV